MTDGFWTAQERIALIEGIKRVNSISVKEIRNVLPYRKTASIMNQVKHLRIKLNNGVIGPRTIQSMT